MTELKKSIGFVGLVSLGAAGIMGTSWIYTNGKFFAQYGAGGEIFGLSISIVLGILIAIAYGELATIFPRAGGETVYTYVAFGKKTSFIAGWALIGGYMSSLAFYVTASGLLLSTIFPQVAIGPYYTIADTKVHLTELAFGVSLTILVLLFNFYGAKLTSGVQKWLFGVMLIIGTALVIVGFTYGKPSNFWPAFYPTMNPWLSITRFMLPAMTFLTGFELVAVMAEEANMEAKKIGWAIILSVILAGGFHVIVVLSSAWIMPWQQVATMSMGTVDAFTIAGFPMLGYAAFAISCLGLMTSFLGLFAAAPRLILSLARANMLPEAFAKVHPKYGTPTNALWLILVFTLGFGWLGKGAMLWFLDMGGFTIAIAWVLTVLSLFKIRKQYPHLKGAFRAPNLTLTMMGGIAALIVAVATIIPGTDLSLEWPYEYGMLAVWTILGIVMYMLSCSRNGNDEANLKALLGSDYKKILPLGENEK